MTVEIGHAALAIIPSFDGLQSNLERGSSKAMVAAGKSGGKEFGDAAGDEATKGIGSKITDWSKKGAIALGGAAGFAIGYGLREGLQREAIGDKVAASLGLSPEKQRQQGKIAGSLYAHAFGESYEDVANAVAATTSSLPKLQGNGEIRRASRDALNFAAVFDVDIPRAVQVAGTVINSGLAKNASQAFDLLTRSSQKVPAQLREDVLDAAEEYGQFFKTLGYDGPAAFDLLVRGAKQGQYGIDKTGDAIKEFTILLATGAKSTTAALNFLTDGAAKDFQDAFLAGGDIAKSAMADVVEALLKVKDPSDQAAQAIALFGTPVEDLNVAKIPAFLRSLQGTKGGLDDVKGAAEKMGDTLNDNTATKITALKRKLETDLVEFMSSKGLPALESFVDFLKDDAGPAISDFKDDVQPVVDVVKDLVGAFGDLPTGAKLTALTGVLAGGAALKVRGGGGGLLGSAGSALGIAKPIPVFVTNPGGIGGGVPGAGGKPGVPSAPVLAGGSSLLNKFIKYGGPGALIAGAGAFADRGVIDEKGNPAKVANEEQTQAYLDSFKEIEISLDGVRAKASGFGGELDLIGSTKVDPKFGTPGLREANERIADFIGKQIEARQPIDSVIRLSGYERAMQQLATLRGVAATAGNIDPSRGVDNGVPFASGGVQPRAGINFNGPINVQAHDYNDFTAQLQKKTQRVGLGGRP